MKQQKSPSVAVRRVSVPNDVLFGEVARQLAAGCSVTLRAKGGSMYPFLVDGRDWVVLRRSAAFGPGDIVLARTERGWVLHRVAGIRPGCVTLMGDAHLRLRETCRPEDVCGVVFRIVRAGRTVDCAGRGERLWVACWRRLRPLRRALLFVLRRCGYGKGGVPCA